MRILNHLIPVVMGLFLPLLSGEFTVIPKHYGVGGSVILKCHLKAPNGTQFKSIVPALITDEISNPITFDEIHEMLNGRYNGLHIPNENRTDLRGVISILFLMQSDLTINFTCYEQLENGTSIQTSIRLNRTQPTDDSTHHPK